MIIGNSVTTIGGGAFNGCSSLTSVTIPKSVTTIGGGAFYNCSSLTSVTIPSSVTRIGASVFSDCSSLMSVTIPNSVTEISEYAFYNCSGLTKVIIGNSVTTIGANAFNGCSSLTTLYTNNTIPPNVKYGNFTNEQYMHLTVYVPQVALEAYQRADEWKSFWNLQANPTGIEKIQAETGKTVYYDLRGSRLPAPKRGLNIIKGKKVITK